MGTKKYFCLVILALFINRWGSATTYYSLSSGNLNSLATWGINTNGTGSNPTTFLGTAPDTFIVANRASFTHNATWQLSSSKVVIIGDGVSAIALTISGVNGTIENTNIILSALANLILANYDGLNVSVMNSTFISIDNASTITYNTTGGSPIMALTYGNLFIGTASSNNCTLTGNTTVNSVLTISNNRTILVGSQTINIKGTIGASTGSLITNNNSIINVGVGGTATGNLGVLRFSGVNPEVKILNISLASTNATISLGNSIILKNNGVGKSYFNYDYGCFDLAGNSMTIDVTSGINCPANYGDGYLIGSASSNIIIYGKTANNFGGDALHFHPTLCSLNSLYLNEATFPVLNIGSPLVIFDSISVPSGEIYSNGNLILNSTSSKKARVGLVGASSILDGDVIMRNFIPGTSSGWANLGTPGIINQTVSNWDTWVSSGQTKGLPMTCQGCIYGVTGTGSYFESIQGWTESSQTYDSTLTNVSNLTPGKGFWVYVGSGLNSTTDLLLENTGPAVTGATIIPITKLSANGYNLIANPYPSPISWTKVMAISGNSSIVQNAVYIWNADLASGAGATTSFVGGTASPGGITSANDVIPAGQGFYVQALAAGSLAFNEGVKVASNTSANPLLRPAKENVGQVFRVKVEGQDNDWDASVFRIHPMATPGFDGAWDAHKLFTSPGYAGYPGVYSKYTTISSKDSKGEDYSIHSFPEPSADLTIPLLVRVKQSGTYTITGLELENIPSCLILKDKLLNKTQDLQMGDYVFTISDTTSTPRFELLLCRGASAPTAIKPNKIDAHSVQILKVDNGVLVNTSFAQNTDAKIEVFNLLGQSLCNKIEISGLSNSTVLPVDLDNNIVLVKITTATDSYSKKVLLR